jgi:cell division protein FtsL
MNAAARLVHQGVLSRHLVLSHLLTKQQMAVLMLGLAILLTALSIIYTTHATREMRALYHHHLVQHNQLSTLQGQLLLERSTLLSQARIEKIAINDLAMVVPDHQSIKVIEE